MGRDCTKKGENCTKKTAKYTYKHTLVQFLQVINLQKLIDISYHHNNFRSQTLFISPLLFAVDCRFETTVKPTGEVVHHLNVYRAKFRKTFCQTCLNTSQFLR